MKQYDFIKDWDMHADENFNRMKEFWDLRASDFDDLTNSDEDNDDLAEKNAVISILKKKGALKKDFEVLDIGCGAGRFMVEFAPLVKNVVGIDVSPKMIDFCMENMERRGLYNASYYSEPWQSMNLEEKGFIKRFDLVFAFLSPAINCSTALFNMNQASKKFCMMSGFVKREGGLREEILELLNVAKHVNKNNIYYAFNILWEEGYHPEISYHNKSWTKKWSLDKAIEIYVAQFKESFQDREDKEELYNLIKDYLSAKSVSGYVQENVEAKAAWLFWEV